jgi:hypothetical protein
MYIEFQLPSGSAGQAAAHSWATIRRAVSAWAEQHEIPYTTKLIKYTARIVFDDDTLCNFFALSYTGPGRFRIVDPLNNLT